METAGTICEGEWNSSFNGICEEADFMAQLLGNYSLPNASFWAANESSYKDVRAEESSVYSSEETNASIFSFSLGDNSTVFPSSSHHFANNSTLMAMDYGKNNGIDFVNQDDSVDSDEKPRQESFKEDKASKRPQIPSGSQRSKRLKNSAKADENDENNNTTSGCSSEDDSINGVKSSSSSKRSGAQNINGKARASRGSATDPQSLYARKRREKINERLRVLQTLVPNGTKVDISTMLEEAVIYVKFLQLQIKLLSSDDLWMYAPIAYNGMDLGLDFKNTPSPKPQSS